MSEFLLEYLPVVMLLGVAVVFSLALLIAPAVIAPKQPDTGKIIYIRMRL